MNALKTAAAVVLILVGLLAMSAYANSPNRPVCENGRAQTEDEYRDRNGRCVHIDALRLELSEPTTEPGEVLQLDYVSHATPDGWVRFDRRYVPVPKGFVRSTRRHPIETVDGRMITLRRACKMHKARNIVVCPNGDVVIP
jgi:hypothetical protein